MGRRGGHCELLPSLYLKKGREVILYSFLCVLLLFESDKHENIWIEISVLFNGKACVTFIYIMKHYFKDWNVLASGS